MTCIPLQTQLLQMAATHLWPINVTIELLHGCNLKCVHCYNFDRTTGHPSPSKESLSKDRMLTLLEEIKAAGGLHIAFTGGEALLHPHLFTYIEKARTLRLAVRLKSNATLLTLPIIERLRSLHVEEIEVSLYGATAEVHDGFTGVPGSFVKTRRAILLCKEQKLSPMISYVLHKACVHEVPAMMDWAEENQIPCNVAMELTARYDQTASSLDYRLDAKDLLQLYTGPKADHFLGHENPHTKLQCACAVVNCGIGYDGTVYPCIGAPLPSGNVRDQSFGEIWNHSPQFLWIRGLKEEDFKDCQPCKFKSHCQRSSGAILTNTGNYTGSEAWTCEQAELLQTLSRSEPGL